VTPSHAGTIVKDSEKKKNQVGSRNGKGEQTNEKNLRKEVEPGQRNKRGGGLVWENEKNITKLL